MLQNNALRFIAKHADFLLVLFGVAVLSFGMSDFSFADGTGGQIFHDYACKLINSVLADDFGAMCTVIAGGLAVLAAIMGAFKGAWALVFVSVGCFIFEKLVNTIFTNFSC